MNKYRGCAKTLYRVNIFELSCIMVSPNGNKMISRQIILIIKRIQILFNFFKWHFIFIFIVLPAVPLILFIMKLSVWKNCKNTSVNKKNKIKINKNNMKKQQKGNKELQFLEFCTFPCLLAAFYVSVTADLYPLIVFILFFFF